MATITLVANPALVTAGDTNENVIVFHPNFNDSMDGVLTAAIEIVSGTINFNTDGQPAANGASYTTAGTKFIVSFKNSTGISFKAASAADQFKVSF